MEFTQLGLFHDVGNMDRPTKRRRDEDEDELGELRYDHKVKTKCVMCAKAGLMDSLAETSHFALQILPYNQAYVPLLPSAAFYAEAPPHTSCDSNRVVRRRRREAIIPISDRITLAVLAAHHEFYLTYRRSNRFRYGYDRISTFYISSTLEQNRRGNT